MNASGASCGILAVLVSAVLAQPAIAAVGAGASRPSEPALRQLAQTTTQPLPSLQVGPPPVIIAPPAPERPKAEPAQEAPRPSLQLRVDPATGKPLTAEELKSREAEGADRPRMLTPRRLTRPAGTADQATGAAPAAAKKEARSSDIMVQPLTGPDAGSVGALDPEQGGFGHDMWAGTRRALVLRLLPTLPAGSPSPAMQSLLQRLLLSTAVSPAGEGDGAALLQARIDGMWRAGQVDGAQSLLRLVPQTVHSRALDGLRLAVLLANGATQDACGLARNMLERAADTALQKTAAFCLAVEKKAAELDLYEQLLRADGVDDPAFYHLLALLAGRPGRQDVELTSPTLLHLAMLRAAGVELPVRLEGLADPLALRLLATMPKLPLAQRLEAAERAASLGSLPVVTLQQIYDAAPFTEAERADVLALAEQSPGALASAALYQAARDAERPATRLAIVEAAWRNAAYTGRRLLAAEAFLPLVQQIQPEPTLAPFAPLAVRVLLGGGEPEKALAWFMGLIPAAQSGQADAAAAVAELTPLVYVADAEGRIPASEVALPIWWQALPADEPSWRRASLVVALLDALGRPAEAGLADAALVLPLTGEGRELTAMAGRRLADAARNQRIGETVLLSLAASGGESPGAVSEPVLVALVAALQDAGLSQSAQSIAVGSLLERGF